MIRKKYVETFNKTCLDLKEKNSDPWVFLDCVLTNTFQELETPAAFPDSEPNLKLISTIAERSSELQKLKIDFSSMMQSTQLEKLNPLISDLSSLKHLTSLNLHQLHDSHRSILKLIGHACPLLIHLSISGLGDYVDHTDILCLILGRNADILFRKLIESPIDGDQLEFLLAPPEFLTPFCFTLRHLDLPEFGIMSSATFALRHLPKLEKMDGRCTSYGVEGFESNASCSVKAANDLLNECFENVCKAYLDHSTANNFYPTFSGDLKIFFCTIIKLNLIELCFRSAIAC